MHIYLEIMISLVGLFILFSILNSIFLEWLGERFNARGRFLKSKIFNFLDGHTDKVHIAKSIWKIFTFENRKSATSRFRSNSKNLSETTYNHGLIKPFFKSEYRWPSHLEPKQLARSIVSQLYPAIQSHKDGLGIDYSRLNFNVPDSIKKQIEISLAKESTDTSQTLEKDLGLMINGYMDSVTHWYKNRVRIWLFLLGFVGAVLFNIDTIRIYDHFKDDSELRKEYYNLALVLDKNRDQLPVDTAKFYAIMDTFLLPSADKNQVLDSLIYALIPHDADNGAPKVSDLGIKWNGIKVFQNADTSESSEPTESNKAPEEPEKPLLIILFGYFLTGLALSFGATFWFKILSQLIRIGNPIT